MAILLLLYFVHDWNTIWNAIWDSDWDTIWDS